MRIAFEKLSWKNGLAKFHFQNCIVLNKGTRVQAKYIIDNVAQAHIFPNKAPCKIHYIKNIEYNFFEIIRKYTFDTLVDMKMRSKTY